MIIDPLLFRIPILFFHLSLAKLLVLQLYLIFDVFIFLSRPLLWRDIRLYRLIVDDKILELLLCVFHVQYLIFLTGIFAGWALAVINPFPWNWLKLLNFILRLTDMHIFIQTCFSFKNFLHSGPFHLIWRTEIALFHLFWRAQMLGMSITEPSFTCLRHINLFGLALLLLSRG